MAYGRRTWNPAVLADLSPYGEACGLGSIGEKDIRSEGQLFPKEICGHRLCKARGKVPELIEFAVVRQIPLRYDGKHLPPVDHRRCIIELIPVFKGKSHKNKGIPG